MALALENGAGRWLMHRRPDHKHHGGLWEFPGGKVESGEDPEEALVREIREELGVEIVVNECLGTHRVTGGEQPGEERCIELSVYTATLAEGRIRLAEHRAYGWFGRDALDGLRWSSADRPFLADLKELLASGEPSFEC